VAISPRKVPWWKKELICIKTSTRQIFNKAEQSGDRESHKMAPIGYNMGIRKAK
jgi:hypothetical protein